MIIPFFNYSKLYLNYKSNFDKIFYKISSKGSFIMQQDLEIFEKNLSKFHGIDHCIGVNNATDAMQLLLVADNIGVGDEIQINVHSNTKEFNVENKDSYIIVNVNAKAVKNLTYNATSQRDKYQKAYNKKKYKTGEVDCFTFAMEILNDRLAGDLKPNPIGEDNNERFDDLKKGRS
jgi:dTDP-4-amino-4,6-dideoxygalactose transaminase